MFLFFFFIKFFLNYVNKMNLLLEINFLLPLYIKLFNKYQAWM